MKCFDPRLGPARRLLAFSVSFAVVLSSHVFAFAAPVKSVPKSAIQTAGQTDAAKRELQIDSATATATKAGVLLRWSTNSVADNVGFNVYRVSGGQRTRVNREIIPGAMFAAGTPAMVPGYSYSWVDRGGTAAATYYIESVNVDGATRLHQAISPVVSSKPLSEFAPAPAAPNGVNATESDVFEKSYPAEEAHQPNVASGTLQQQWAIAGQTALKIGIKKDGWYRVTQPQMVAAGFNPTVDIRNLQLFGDADEVAINTSQSSGQFGSGDYIEFYGRGLDVPTTDTRVYYLIAGATAGKRVTGQIHLDGDPVVPPVPVATPPALPSPAAATAPVLRDPIFWGRWLQYDSSIIFSSDPNNPPAKPPTAEPEKTSAVSAPASPLPDPPAVEYHLTVRERQPTTARAANANKSTALANTALAVVGNAPRVVTTQQSPVAKTGSQTGKTANVKKRRGSKRRRSVRTEHSHVVLSDGFAAANFDNTFQIKDRGIYYSSLLNGDEENFFGAVISSPVTLNLQLPNLDSSAVGPATLEFALQGVLNNQTGASHQVSVAINGVTVGEVAFGPLDHPVSTFPIPITQLLSGANTIKFTKISTGELCIVDYVRLTYPHLFNADSGSLKFNLRGSQTRTVDGFAVPTIRLIDYTDPLNVGISKPGSQPSALGYAITVPVSESRSKNQRLLYAFPEGQFDLPASLSLNQPSTLNLNSNAADFVIISYKTFIPSFTANVSPINTSLLAQRTAQGFIPAVVDIDDVYDEFSYGEHGPQAIKSFLQYAKTNWATAPRYVIFAGDASLDPRNYLNIGDFDLVPTKDVDATFSETVSDDWLTDFDDDGVADIPVGRLPFRTLADANLVVSKIVNFTPVVPQSALLIADQDEFDIFGFAHTNDVFEGLLQGAMTVDRLNRAPQPSGVPSQPDNQIRTDMVNAFNQGRALVNYSGHGQVDVWTNASLFKNADALAMTNGNKLSFVVVMDCLNGYFQDPSLLSLSEAFLEAPQGGAVAAFASSGLTVAQGQHDMGRELYTRLYGGSPMALGDAIKIAKGATSDIDVKRTWIFFGDPSLKIR
jgi:hypothetical protein